MDTQTIIYNKPIEFEGLYYLVEKLEEAKENNKIPIVYFTSSGGTSFLVEPFVRILEEHEVELRAVGYIESSGLHIFLKYHDYRKELFTDTYGMLHLPYVTSLKVDIKGNVDETDDYKIQKSVLQKEVEIISKCGGLTGTQIKEYQSGKEVYLNHEEIIKLNKKYKQYIENNKQNN